MAKHGGAKPGGQLGDNKIVSKPVIPQPRNEPKPEPKHRDDKK